jgi:hypothetical protein
MLLESGRAAPLGAGRLARSKLLEPAEFEARDPARDGDDRDHRDGHDEGHR